MMGVESKERPARLEEMIQALRVLWSDEHASFHGKYYSFDDVNLLPKPAQQPCPIYIAGTPRSTQIGDRGVERSLRRIARYADGWMTNQIELAMFQDYLGRLRDMLVGRGARSERIQDRFVLRHLRECRSGAGVSPSKNFSRRLLSKGLYPAGR